MEYQLTFGTGNENKAKEVSLILGIEVKTASLEVEEIQNRDPEVVARAKARAYYEKLGTPVFAEDVALTFTAHSKVKEDGTLDGFPGAYIKDFIEIYGNEGLIKMLDGQVRTAVLQDVVVYIDENGEEHVFKGVINGSIAESQRGESGFGFDPIFIPEGQEKTFAEMNAEEKNMVSHRGIAFGKLKDYLAQKVA